jgi:hypothetical protein
MGGYGQAPPAVQRLKGRNTSTDTNNKELFPASGAGHKNWISKITVSNSNVANGTQVQIKSGTTIIWTIPVPTGKGGALEVFPDPIDCNEGEALNFSCDDAVATVTVSAAGYRAVTPP